MSLKIWLPLNGNIENQGTLNTTSRLPSGYTEVEYLESTGTQYIDTGVDNNTNSIKLYTTIQVTVPASTSAYALGYYTDNQGQFFLYRSGTVWQWAWRCSYLNSTGVFDTNKHSHIFYVENNIAYYKLDGQIVSQHSTDRAGGRIYIAGNKHNQSTVRTFTAAIDDGNTVKRNFIPCYRNSDNKPGMYDTMTGTFYTNAGSGEFSVGPAVTCSITNNGATIDNNGKIGKCYSFNGSDSYISTSDITYFSPDNTRSICFWMYSNSETSAAIIGTGRTTWQWVVGTNGNKIRVHQWNSSGVDSIYLDSKSTITINTWYHIGITWDKSVIKLYINGQFDSQMTPLYTTYRTQYTTNIGGNCYYNQGNSFFNGKLNDIRIYDECLSADQIKEISRGMVLHYKMCQPERSENLLSNWCNITKWSSEGVSQVSVESDSKFNKVLTFTPSSGTMRIYYSTSNVWTTNGATFTVSGYVKSSSASTIRFSRSIADYGAGIATTTSWKKFSTVITLTGTSTSGTLSIQGSNGIKYYLANLKLERGTNPNPQWSPAPSDNPNWGTIEYDGSGFKNHGTVSGNVTLSADSPRYTGSYKFGTNNYITTTSTGNYIKSATFWAKDAGSVPSDGLVFRDQNSGLAFGIQSGNLITGAVGGPAGSSSASISVSNAKYTANTWHFFACVNDNGTQRLYMDGIQISTGTGTGNWSQGSPTNSLNVGGRAGSSYWPGYISDFKMYVTVLSATDVQELYKLGRN